MILNQEADFEFIPQDVPKYPKSAKVLKTLHYNILKPWYVFSIAGIISPWFIYIMGKTLAIQDDANVYNCKLFRTYLAQTC